MNMISTGAFLNEMDASDKQKALVKKLTAAWEKKNAKAAKAGGASLLALSLAACGSSEEVDISSDNEQVAADAFAEGVASVDITTDNADAFAEGVASVDITTDNADAFAEGVASVDITSDNAGVIDAATAPLEQQIEDLEAQVDQLENPTSLNVALSDDDAADTLPDAITGTSSNDSISATDETLDATDVVIDASATDSDTLTVSISDGANATSPTSVSGIENVVYNVTGFNTPAIDVAGINGGTVTVNNTNANGSNDANVDNVSLSTNVVLGAGITGAANVEVNAGHTGSIDAGSATTLTVDSNNADDTVTVTVNGDIAMTTDTATTIALSATAASTVTLSNTEAGGPGYDTVTGDANLTLAFGSDGTNAITAADLDGMSITGFAVVETSGGAGEDLSGIDATIELQNTSNIVVGNNANIDLTTAAGTIDLDLTDGDADVDLEGTVTITGSVDTNSNAITIDQTASSDNITTINFVAAEAQTDLEVVAADSTLVLTGAEDVSIEGTNTALTALDASDFTGALTVTAIAANLDITGGSGDDSVTIGAGLAGVLDGGDGNDTIDTTGDQTGATFANFEVLALSGATDLLASQISGATYVVTGNQDIDIGDTVAASADLATIDLAGLVFASTSTATTTVNLTNGFDATTFTTAQEYSVTGSSQADTITGYANDDTISGGAGDDTISGANGDDTINGGAGDDEITGGAGDDTITGGAGDDDFNINAVAEGIDTITDFVTGADEIDFAAALFDANGTADAALTVITSTGADEAVDAATDDVMVVTDTVNTAATNTVAAADLDDLGEIATLLEELFAVTGDANGDDVIIAAVEASDASGTFGIYAYLDDDAVAATAATIEEAELTHLATVTGDDLVGTDFGFVA